MSSWSGGWLLRRRLRKCVGDINVLETMEASRSMREGSCEYGKGEKVRMLFLFGSFVQWLGKTHSEKSFFLLQWAASDVTAQMFFFLDLLAWLPRACPWVDLSHLISHRLCFKAPSPVIFLLLDFCLENRKLWFSCHSSWSLCFCCTFSQELVVSRFPLWLYLRGCSLSHAPRLPGCQAEAWCYF